jgi:hypothetical protein
MKPNQWIVLVLKPTKAFLSFLKAQLPSDVELPDLQLIQTDSTAYVIKNQDSDEAMLDEIEREFPRMFKHEISRWLGIDAWNKIEGTFLDFLCCFKFELHSNMIVLESTLAEGNQVLRIKPRSVLLKWIKSSIEDNTQELMVQDRVEMSQMAENATVVVKNFPKLADIKDFMHLYYYPLFEAEMHRLGHTSELWPNMESYETFSRYFTVQIHTHLVHLTD